MKKFWFLSLITAGLLIWSCSSDSSGEGVEDDDTLLTFDRGALLENWADNIILPAYESFQLQLEALSTSYAIFSADRSTTNLEAFRLAWLSTYMAWQQVSLFEIGPTETAGLRLNINTYPIDVSLIGQFVATGDYDLSLPSNRDAKGFPALDYILNGLETDDTALLTRFDDPNLLAYVQDVLDDMSSLTNTVVDEWQTSFRDAFVANDGSSVNASVDRFVNDYIFYYERFLRAGKMGIPAGVFSGTPEPQTVEAFYDAEISNMLFLEGLATVQDFFNGRHFGSNETGESLASYLKFLDITTDGEALDVVINNQYDLARSQVEALNPFLQEIEENVPVPTNLLLAYDEVQRIVPLIKVDMLSALNISVDFADADGD